MSDDLKTAIKDAGLDQVLNDLGPGELDPACAICQNGCIPACLPGCSWGNVPGC
jgi:hypothetical protein